MALLVLALLSGCHDYAITRSQVQDLYDQTAREGAVDVLWVEDDSATMFEEQAALAEHADAFIGVLATTSLEFRVGVVTTDMDRADAGVLVGPVLGSDTPGLTDAFASQILGQTVGSRNERGLDAAVAAVAPNGPNADFDEGIGDLEVIVYADEDDQSTAAVADLVQGLTGARPAATVRVNAIVGDLPDGCFSLTAAADPGARYLEAQASTGGVRASICDPDMDAMLSRVAHAVLGLQTSFALSKLPVLSSMEVYVDGASIPERDVDGWHYDAVNNAVVFDGWAVPQAGAGIEIDYWDWTSGSPPDTGS